MEYDPFSFELQRDPYPVYAWLRDEHPVYHSERWGFWAVSRYDDVRRITREWQEFSNREGVDIDHTEHLLAPGGIDELDPPSHDVLRKLMQFWFSPKSIRGQLTGALEDEVERIIEELRERDEFDVVEEFAFELPTFVVSRLFDLPAEDRPTIRSLMRPVFRRIPDDPNPPQEAIGAGAAIAEYLLDAIRTRRRQSPQDRDDLLSVLICSELDGAPLTDAQVLSQAAFLFVAGSGTTQDNIASLLHLLAEHPDERAKLLADPTLIPNAVEESLRFESPIQNLRRVSDRAFELHDVVVPAGATVVTVLGSANRDERYWNDPDRFDVSRAPRRHLAFADGIHHCLGAPVARIETQVAVAGFLREMPEYEIVREPERAVSHIGRGLASLPVSPNLAGGRRS